MKSKFMNKNAKYALWLFAVAFGAIVIGQFFITPGPVERGVSKPRTHDSRGRRIKRPTPPPVAATQPSIDSSAQKAPSSNLVNANKTENQGEIGGHQDIAHPETIADKEPVAIEKQSGETVSSDTEQSIDSELEDKGPVPRNLTVNNVSELLNLVKTNHKAIKSLTFVNGANTLEVFLENGNKSAIVVPQGDAVKTVMDECIDAGIPISARNKPADKTGSFLVSFGPAILICGVILFVFLRSRSGGGFGKSKAAKTDDGNFEPVDWKNIAGCDEAVTELKRVVKGLVAAWVYRFFRAKRPKGVLLIGPPGTGKTLLARAVATACKGSMIFVSGSEFVEMYVGVGSSRIRDMARQARERYKKTGKPQIIFIDELDALGKARSGKGAINSHEEREQTLNQLLVEMDGLGSSEGIIWIAATNRPEILDQALLRPGRFDTQVYVDKPDKAGRVKLFDIYSRLMPLAKEVTCASLAERAFGCTGADIELICNRAAIMAAEEWADANEDKISGQSESTWNDPEGSNLVPVTYGMSMAGFSRTTYETKEGSSGAENEKFTHPILSEDETAVVTLRHFDEAIDFVKYGDARKSRQDGMQEEEKKNTAFHEAGHALAAEAMEECDPVGKVTIMSRSRALGYVQLVPDGDKFSVTDKQLIGRIVMAMAGRAAQEEYLGVCDAGAENDFQQAVDTARKMVCDWGMSSLRHISLGARSSAMGMKTGYEGGQGIGCGPELQNEIDREWRRIVEACYDIARKIVKADEKRMEAVVAILMDKETILKGEWESLMTELPTKVQAESVKFDPRKKPETEGAQAA